MKQIVKYFFLLIVLTSYNGLTQTFNKDSLLLKLKNPANDLEKTDLLNLLAEEFKKGNPSQSLNYAFEALQLAEEKKYKKGIGDAYNNLGNLYDRQSNYQKSFECHSKALRIREELNDRKGMASSYNNIGGLYFEQRDVKKAVEYYEKSLKIRKEIGDLKAIAASLNNFGGIYYSQKEYGKALDYYFQSLSIKNKIRDNSIGYNFNNIANAYADMGDYDKSLSYFFKALKTWEGEDKRASAVCKISISGIYFEKQDYDQSERYAREALQEAISVKDLASQADIYGMLSQIYAMRGDYKKAYESYENLQSVQDSLNANSSLKDMREAQFRVDMEKKEGSIALLKKDKEIQNLQLSKNRTWIFVLFFGIILIALVLTVLMSRYRVKRNANLLLTKKNIEIEEQKKDITDSINYAKRIQEAILPDKEIKYRAFPDAFVLFMPKDIVSGDFYWFTEKNGKRLIAAVDCTGHGVPGAFMSMIGNAFLNEIINEKGITKPSEILDLLRSNIIKSLKQNGGESKDGMDISILCMEDTPEGTIAEYAGANNPLWKFKADNGSWLVEEIKPDKQPIGFSGGQEFPFTNNRVELNKGDSLYIFTDGYADQFGGPKGKKFKYKQLQDLLLSVQSKKMPEQEDILVKVFKEWKGSKEQVDDVCVIGVRI